MKSYCLIHSSNPSYLEEALKSLKLNFENDNLILIGDETNKEISKKYGFKHYFIDDYTEDFNYYHCSVNNKDYEELCIMRWFVLKNFMEKNQILDVMYFDSDVLILDSEGVNMCYNNNYDVYFYNILSPKCVCVPFIIYLNMKGIQFLTKNLKALYNLKKGEILEIINIIGDKIKDKTHISDMYFLGDIFINNNITNKTKIYNKDLKMKNFNSNIDSYIFFSNFKNIKENIIFIDGKWYLEKSKKKIAIIHFQGNAKCKMKDMLDNIVKRNKIKIDIV